MTNLALITDSEVRALVAEYLPYTDEWGIRSPGKFEGSPLWTVYFYAWAMVGGGEDHYVECEHIVNDTFGGNLECDCELELEYTSFEIEDDDIAIFPDLAGHKYACITNESSGHVSGYTAEKVND